MMAWIVEGLAIVVDWVFDVLDGSTRCWHMRWLRWRVIPRLIWARVKAAWKRSAIGALGLKVGLPDGNARDRRTQIRNETLRLRVGIGKVVARHVRVHT